MYHNVDNPCWLLALVLPPSEDYLSILLPGMPPETFYRRKGGQATQEGWINMMSGVEPFENQDYAIDFIQTNSH
jgi:hypothetical protein